MSFKIEITDEMVRAFMVAYAKADDGSSEVILGDVAEKAGLAAALEIAERELRAHIAYRIRAELVCCDIYERDAHTDRAGRTHAICFWGEAGARIAEEASAPEPCPHGHPGGERCGPCSFDRVIPPGAGLATEGPNTRSRGAAETETP